MNYERTSELERRAILHAALADPARLRITDTLLTGDASPSGLAGMLAMPSNLLAHHVHVLEQAGIITRRRSEGDRRRTYLQLIPGALDSAGPPVSPRGAAGAVRLHRQFRALPPGRSAMAPGQQCAGGIRGNASGSSDRSRRHRRGTRHSLPLPRLRPRHISEVRHDGDLVITVCDLAHEELAEATAVHWSIPNPVPAGNPDSFDAALAQLADASAPGTTPGSRLLTGPPRRDPSAHAETTE